VRLMASNSQGTVRGTAAGLIGQVASPRGKRREEQHHQQHQREYADDDDGNDDDDFEDEEAVQDREKRRERERERERERGRHVEDDEDDREEDDDVFEDRTMLDSVILPIIASLFPRVATQEARLALTALQRAFTDAEHVIPGLTNEIVNEIVDSVEHVDE